MNWGMDFLGGAKYPNIAIKGLPDSFAVGAFSSTFGDSKPFIAKILATGKCQKARIHLAWKDQHNFSTADFPSIVKEARSWLPLINKYPNVTWYLSGACENKLNTQDATTLAKLVMAAVPQCSYVHSGLASKINLPNCLNEVHGSDAPSYNTPYITSFDGDACVDSDMESFKARHKSAEILFLWDAPFNLRKETNDTTPRPQRTYKPSLELIASIEFLTTDRGAVSLPDNWTLKSHAEQKDNGDIRADNPLIIAPLKTSKILLKSKAGKVVSSATRHPEPYIDGRQRYYFSDEFGYQISKKLIKLQGDPRVEVWADNKKWGTANMAFRQGSFK